MNPGTNRAGFLQAFSLFDCLFNWLTLKFSFLSAIHLLPAPAWQFDGELWAVEINRLASKVVKEKTVNTPTPISF